jgi:hypothetical protein
MARDTTTTLANARKALAALEEEAAGLAAARDKALLDGAPTDEAIRINKQIDATRCAVEAEQRRVHLLEQRVAQEEVEAAKRRHEQHIREFEKTLAQADAAGDELQATVTVLEEKFRETIRLRELALSMWPFGRSSHGDAAARAPEGCAMAGSAVAVLLAHELHRVGFEAPLGGRPGEKVKVPLPGGIAPRLTPAIDQKTKRPIPPRPLGEVLRNASRFAVETLRNDLFIPAVVPQPPVPIQVLGVEQQRPAPVPPPASAPAQAAATVPSPSAGGGDVLQEFVPPIYRERLAVLLRQQMQAAASGDDVAYERCIAETTALRAEIDAARKGEAA